MTIEMERFLLRADKPDGVTDTLHKLFQEALNNGWIKYSHTPQNSTTMRYRITNAGQEALRSTI